jgi:hypothetical protein
VAPQATGERGARGRGGALRRPAQGMEGSSWAQQLVEEELKGGAEPKS